MRRECVGGFGPHRFLHGDFVGDSGGRFFSGGDGEVTRTLGSDQGLTLFHLSAQPEPLSSLTPHISNPVFLDLIGIQ